MKLWEQVFKWIGVVAVVALVGFLIFNAVREANFKAAVANFNKVLAEVKPQKGKALTKQQIVQLSDAAKKIGPKPSVSFSSNKSRAFRTDEMGIGSQDGYFQINCSLLGEVVKDVLNSRYEGSDNEGSDDQELFVIDMYYTYCAPYGL